MLTDLFSKFLLLLCVSLMVPSLSNAQESTKLIQKDLVAVSKEDSSTIEKEDHSAVDKQIEAQNRLLKEVIENINNETYLKTPISEEMYDTQINLLNNKININKKEKNLLAVKRDELKLFLINEKYIYDKTLSQIVHAKKSYKDKEYFDTILKNNIKMIQATSLKEYTALYEKELQSENKISKEFVHNYIELHNQSYTQIFVLEYLLKNMEQYRTTNFFIDKFNLQFFVDEIDSIAGISFVSSLTSYYLKFSIGEILIVLVILLFFRLLNTKIIALFAIFIKKIFASGDKDRRNAINMYIQKSIYRPLTYILYLLAIQISIYIFIKEVQLLAQIIPWINTLYMAIFTWALYASLNTGIDIYANKLLDKYPNVRKEMIVFILRIIKIILILLVILFLFTQLGIDINAIAASLGVGGIAIALASKDTLANFFGSLNIMTDNSFSQGDWIRTNNVEGVVVDIRMRTTRIRTFDNAMITIPNSELANTHIVNWSKRRIGRRIKMTLGITYESKMEDIVQLKHDILAMLSEHESIATSRNTNKTQSKKFEVAKREDLQGIKNTLLVYIDSFGPSSIDILIYCFSKSPNWEDWLRTKEDLLIQIEALVQKNNCSIAYPTQTLIVQNEQNMSEVLNIQ
ncbi:MAG: mechanosensitive ion channel family protein [Campylobacterota bacterium]|nr:mechanosensitive ion channel family protein [Campylobacterota bacterium]